MASVYLISKRSLRASGTCMSRESHSPYTILCASPMKIGTKIKDNTQPRIMKIGSIPAKAVSQTFSGWCPIRTVPIKLMPRHIAIAKGIAVQNVIFRRKGRAINDYCCLPQQSAPGSGQKGLTNPPAAFYSNDVSGSSLHRLCNIFSSVREQSSPEYVRRSETFTAFCDAVKVSFFDSVALKREA